jgi:hypothetical protein
MPQVQECNDAGWELPFQLLLPVLVRSGWNWIAGKTRKGRKPSKASLENAPDTLKCISRPADTPECIRNTNPDLAKKK